MPDSGKLVSIVVPVYNTERYLNRCIESIVNQSYKNLEILLIDDGSPDMCPAICDEWARTDSRIKVIHKQNQGLGMARNTGIHHATGEYICFFDSDDYIAIDTIELSVQRAQQYDSEIVIFGNYRIGANGEVLKTNKPRSLQTVFRGEEIRLKLLPDLIDNRHTQTCVSNMCMSAWMCLFSMELIRRTNWFFVSEREIISEDSFSLLELFSFVRSVAILEEALYYHCENAASLTQVYREDRQEKNMHFYHAALELICTLGYSAAVKSSVSCLFINLTISAMKQIVTAEYRLKEKIRLLKDIVTNETVQYALHDISKRKYSLVRRLFLRAMSLKCTFICFVMLCIKK